MEGGAWHRISLAKLLTHEGRELWQRHSAPVPSHQSQTSPGFLLWGHDLLAQSARRRALCLDAGRGEALTADTVTGCKRYQRSRLAAVLYDGVDGLADQLVQGAGGPKPVV
ncbi:hypothetical protein XarjCFBP7653_08040 [Xanthomonas arboricola]|nr:hypothetical protein XarjCFBP7653_08040 [Xanthomonas arboricola]